MEQTTYKYERFIKPNFPVYCSVQGGREVLVISHYHTSFEIVRVLKGKVQILIGTNYHICKEGDILFIPKSVVHRVTSLTSDASICGITFEEQVVISSALSLNYSEIFYRCRQSCMKICEGDSEYDDISECFNTIRSMYGNFNADGRLIIVSSLMFILALYIKKFGLEESANDKKYRKLKDVLDYIDEHYYEKIELEELSKMVHVCDDRLIRLFKEVTGDTPIEYILNLRIESAIRLISDSELSIAEIAEKVGFGSDTYMARVFKKKLNASPGKFR